MERGEVIINNDFCMGCGYCVEFFQKGSLKMADDNFSSQGLPIVEFNDPESCSACGRCVWMCPHFAIEVYKIS